MLWSVWYVLCLTGSILTLLTETAFTSSATSTEAQRSKCLRIHSALHSMTVRASSEQRGAQGIWEHLVQKQVELEQHTYIGAGPAVDGD